MTEYQAGRYRIEILYEDNHLLVVRKPPNMAVQADSSGDLDIQTALKGYIKERYNKPGAVFLALCHRLDRPVGGVMVLCRTSKCAERLTRQFASHTVDKTYLCAVRGEVSGVQELSDFLLKDARGMVRVVDEGTPGAKLARLTATPLAHADGLTLMQVALHTGRSHQIRVQMAHSGHPLWGDNRYGDGRPGQQIALWATSLAIDHPTTGERLCFDCPPPDAAPWGLWRICVKDGIIEAQTCPGAKL